MTLFEEFALEIIGKVETDNKGFYKGHTLALMRECNKVILSDELYSLSWDRQKEIIKSNFYKLFPYLKRVSE